MGEISGKNRGKEQMPCYDGENNKWPLGNAGRKKLLCPEGIMG